MSLRNKEVVQVTRRGGGYGQESPDGKFIYYEKPRASDRYDFGLFPEIWRMPSGGGPEELVVNVNELTDLTENTWFWRVTTQGIYFVDNSAKPHPLLKFFGFAPRTVRTVRQLEKPAWGGPGLAISPDGQYILMAQVDDAGSDIMLVENFHCRPRGISAAISVARCQTRSGNSASFHRESLPSVKTSCLSK